MEDSTPAPPILDFRQRLFALGRRLCAAPYLPNALIIFTLLIILSDNFILLIQQPAAFWADYTNAVVSITWLQQLMSAGPWLFSAVIVVYVVILGLVLYLGTRPLTLPLWMVASYLHLRSLIVSSKCGLKGIYRLSAPTDCDTFELVLVVLLVGLLGLVFSRTLLTTGKTAASRTRRRLLRLPLSFIILGWLLFLGIALARNVDVPRLGWYLIELENPPLGRVHGPMAYDTNRQTAVLFGGASAWLGEDWLHLNDTWEWDGTDWHQRQPQTIPPARVEHALTFDETRGVTVMFGGSNSDGLLQDTWEWDGRDWQRRSPETSPSPRCCHKMFFDNQRGRVIVYGGYDRVNFFNDAWEWDGDNWQAITFETTSPVISGFPLAYDTRRNRVVTLEHGGTWVWQGESWSILELDRPQAPVRGTTNMAYDASGNQMVLFGGIKDGRDILNDTWLFNGQAWWEITTRPLPTGRWGHAIFYDTSRQRVVLFGGFDGANYNNDLWEFFMPE